MKWASATERDDELLDELQKRVGCTYLSNLYESQWAAALIHILRKIPSGAYSVPIWQETARYIMQQNCEADMEDEIRAMLYDSLQTRAERLSK